MKMGGIFLLCLLCQIGKPQQKTALEDLLAAPELKHAAVGISVKRVSDGRPVLVYQEGMALTPASVTKLLPSFFALKKKGSGFRFHTSVYYTGSIQSGTLSGDLVIQSGGDPCVESRYFPEHRLSRPVVAALERAGIRRIAGQIRVEGAKEGTEVPGSWLWEDVSNYYAALYLPFNYRDNAYIFEFRTGAAGTPAVLKRVDPPLSGVEVVHRVVASADPSDRAWIYGGPYSRTWCIRGTLPQQRSGFRIRGAMSRPAEVWCSELARLLEEKGIVLGKGGQVGGQKRLLLDLPSPTIGEMVYYTNKFSVNLFAEALGALLASGGEWPQEMAALLENAGISAEGLQLKDACGLSVMNAAPAQLFTDLLVYAAKEGIPAFRASLPEAGRDGGLAGYVASAPALKGRLTAKTGSMSGVRCLSGYLTPFAGEPLAFTILINHYTGTALGLQRAVGRFLQRLLF